MAETKNSAGVGTRIYGLVIVAGLLLIVAIVVIYVGSSGTTITGSGAPSSLGADVESALRIAQDPSRGEVPDFQTLSQRIKSVDTALTTTDGGSLSAGWKSLHDPLNVIVGSEPQIKRTASNASAISAAVPGISSTYEQLASKLGAKGAAPGQLMLAADQLVRLQRIRGIALDVLGSGNDAQATATRLDNETKTFARNIALLAEPSAAGDLQAAGAEDLAKKAKADFAAVQTAVAAIVDDSPALNKAQQASATVASASASVIEAARKLDQGIRSGTTTSAPSSTAPFAYAALALALILLAIFAVVSLSAVRRREKLAEEKEARQQQAILNLLDEITNLANGDLTVDVTVTEDFTGAIADSINYTVQTLRGLVGTINQTSEQIVASAASTQDTAARMSQASDRQAREIASVTTSVSSTSNQLQEVAGRAERLAVQAQTSVQIAHNGAGTVGRTIQSMAALREQIQDTAKRIKRLGESSQEIGNITELINDIAEQTNTLALNASIQAAMAGEQGRGFAVVADEVQRLAERAGSATRQIENLVKTIQADTNEAIISMERSTANVVSGAKSAEEAGQSLTRIESSSQELAKLIQEISVSARGQSAEATKIAGTMQGIREIAVQTSGSADRTSKAVGELNSLSDKLRESVAGFKLPAEAAA